MTWIPTTSYDLQEDATVYDLYTKAIGEAGLRSIGEENDYVRTIYAPSCLGGYALSEFTNGARSGWMYTVNGTHPDRGLKNWKLKDGDVVVWHYINDYAHEAADWFDDPDYPALGDGTYYNGWLRAADISPEQYVQQLLGKILKVGKNGSVEPKLTLSHIGRSVTFTFKPDKGYHVKDVKVDGKSVGAVTTYTVDKLTVSTRIEVEFTNGVLPFTDVREADWFYDDVVYAYENGLFSGTSDTTFSPNASMTRAMLVTVLYRLEGQPTVSGRSGFSDVKLNSYYEDAVTWAADNGIVNGHRRHDVQPERQRHPRADGCHPLPLRAVQAVWHHRQRRPERLLRRREGLHLRQSPAQLGLRREAGQRLRRPPPAHRQRHKSTGRRHPPPLRGECCKDHRLILSRTGLPPLGAALFSALRPMRMQRRCPAAALVRSSASPYS